MKWKLEMDDQQQSVAMERKEVPRFELGQQPSRLDRLKLENIGLLNPEWLEWFMGWPTGWTELEPLEMDKFQSWQQQHGGF